MSFANMVTRRFKKLLAWIVVLAVLVLTITGAFALAQGLISA